MVQRIQVVETVVYEYEPDYQENSYAVNNITTARQALEFDQKEYEAHKISLGELCYNIPTCTAVWSVIDDGT